MILQSIRVLIFLTIAATVGALALPLNEYHAGWYGGMFSSFAFILAVVRAYRTEAHVQTRGGLVSKAQEPGSFLFAHVIIGMFGFVLLLTSLLGVVGLMG